MRPSVPSASAVPSGLTGGRGWEAVSAEEEGAVVATAAEPEFFYKNGLHSLEHILFMLMGQDPI